MMELAIAGASLFVAIIALALAFWQGKLSKKQLDLAESTTDKTRDYLDEIRDLAKTSDSTLKRLERSVEDRIQRIVDHKLDQDRQSSAEASAAMSAIGNGIGSLFKMAVDEVVEDSKLEREMKRRATGAAGESEL
jgi:hypothetical protein